MDEEDGSFVSDEYLPTALSAWKYKLSDGYHCKVNVVGSVPDKFGGRSVLRMYDSDLTERKGDWIRPLKEIPPEIVALVYRETGVTLMIGSFA